MAYPKRLFTRRTFFCMLKGAIDLFGKIVHIVFFIDWRNASPGTDLFVFYNIQICLASYKENVIIRKASCRYTRFPF